MGISVRRRTDGGAATPATGRPGRAARGLPRTGILDASRTYDRACPCDLAGRYPVPWLGRRAGERREPAPGLPRNVSHPGSGKPPLAPAPGRTLTARRPVFSKSSSFKVRFFKVQALQGPGVSGPLSRPFVKRGHDAVPSWSGQRAAGIFCVPFSRKSGSRIPRRRMKTCDTRWPNLLPGADDGWTVYGTCPEIVSGNDRPAMPCPGSAGRRGGRSCVLNSRPVWLFWSSRVRQQPW